MPNPYSCFSVPPSRSTLLVLLLIAAFGGSAAAQNAKPALALRAPPQSARVFARDGSLLAEIGPEARTVVALKSLPAYLPRTFVAVEDRRFYEHNGVDPVGVARAVRANIEEGFGSEGASTITQQLVGAMFPDRVDRDEKSVERKLREAKLATELERRYSKAQILEAYLNQIYLGHGWYGVESAARHFFGKPAATLSIEETAMRAALPKGPGVYSPKINPQRARERRDLVLGIMAQSGIITAAAAAAAKQRPIRLAPNHGYASRPQWVIEQVRQFLESEYGPTYGRIGLRVWTTIDPVAQNAADSALIEGLQRAEAQPWYRGPKFGTAAANAGAGGTNYLQGLVVSVDARTGEILAMTGGREFKDSRFNRVTQARRQPGSAFKPIVYATALEHGVSPSTVMQDTALRIPLAGSRVYEPRNSDDRFRGPISVRDALTESVNTVAIQLGMEVGLNTVAAAARRFGITTPVPAYPSSMIGAAVVRPVELAGAYTALANRGVRVDPFLIRRVTDRTGKTLVDRKPSGARVTSPEIAFLTTSLLRDAAERGTGQEARQRLPARVPMAGKTGTTNGGTDVWYVGYTPEIVTAVWVGFDKPKGIGEGAFGSTLAAPIWGEMMRDVYERRPAPAPWAVPAGVVSLPVDAVTGSPATEPCPAEPAARDFFLARTVPPGACGAVPVGTPTDPLPTDSLPADSIPLDDLPALPDSAATGSAATLQPPGR